MKPPGAAGVGTALLRTVWGQVLDTETGALVQRWILAFCEAPVLIDPELMRRVLDDVEAAQASRRPPTGESGLRSDG